MFQRLGRKAPGLFDATDTTVPVEPPRRRRPDGPGLTPDGRLRSGRLAGLSMRRAIWVISWPILVESSLNSLVWLTDVVLAAHLAEGEAATSAIGGASYIMWFMGLIVMAIGVGATALVSRAVGGSKMGVANAALGQTMILAVGAGFMLTVVVGAVTPIVGRLLNFGDQASLLFRDYMVIMAAGIPFTTVLFSGIACARGAGDSIRPLLAMAVVNVVNIVVSFLLAGPDIPRPTWLGGGLIANPIGLHLGVQGIAIGTLAAHAVGAAIILVMAVRGTWGIRLRRTWLRPHWHTIRRLVRVGLPNFFETSGMWVGNFLVILMVGQLAREQGELIGAYVVAIRVEGFSFLPGFAMGAAAAALCGQYLGAGSPAHARKAVMICMGMALGLMGTIGILFLTMPAQIVGLLTSQPIHRQLAPQLVAISGAVQVPFAISIVFRAALRGAGDVKVVFIITWITTYAVRLPLAYLLSGVDIALPEALGGGILENPSPYDGGLAWLWAALCGEIVIRAIIFTARFLRGGWSRIRV